MARMVSGLVVTEKEGSNLVSSICHSLGQDTPQSWGGGGRPHKSRMTQAPPYPLKRAAGRAWVEKETKEPE